MAEQEEGVVVKIDEKPAEAAKQGQEAQKEAVNPLIEDLRKQQEKLEANLAAEKQHRENAQRRELAERQARTTAEQQVLEARTQTEDIRTGSIDRGLEAAQTEAAAAKAEWIVAQEAGDWKRAADANERLADARAQIRTLTDTKAYTEQQKLYEQQRVQRAPAQATDPLENYIQQSRLSAASADWARSHPDWIADQRKNARLVGAHYDAVDVHNLTVDTPQYFEHIEKMLGLRKEETMERKEAPTEARQARKAAPPVLPVGSSLSTNSGVNEVRLSKREVETATDGTITWQYNDPNKRFKKGDPIGIEEYARRKKSMQEQGLYDRIYVDGQ